MSLSKLGIFAVAMVLAGGLLAADRSFDTSNAIYVGYLLVILIAAATRNFACIFSAFLIIVLFLFAGDYPSYSSAQFSSGIGERLLAIAVYAVFALILSGWIQSAKYFRNVMDAAPNALLVVTTNGLIVRGNRQAAEVLECNLNTLKGSHINRFIPADYHGTHSDHIRSYLQAPTRRSLRSAQPLPAVTANGRSISVEIGLAPLKRLLGMRILVSLVEVTELVQLRTRDKRRAAEITRVNKSLKASNKNFQAIIDAAPNALIIADKEGAIISANLQAEATFECDREALLSTNIDDYVPAHLREKHAELRNDYVRNPMIRPLSNIRVLPAVTAKGNEISILIGLAPLQTEWGLQTLASIVDVTERHRMRKELEKRAEELSTLNDDLVEANRNLDEFVYTASHDLKEPLRGIAGYARILDEDYGAQLGDDGRHYLAAIGRLCSRMQALMDALLAISKTQRAEITREKINMQVLVDEVMDNLHIAIQEKKVRINVALAMPNLFADKSQARQLLQNLLANAIRFADPENPLIEIGSTTKTPPAADAPVTVYYVQDNGIGIAEQFHDRIFLLFNQLDRKDRKTGVGAGLTIVKRIIDRHDGQIWVESAPGQGAIFYFNLGQD